METSKCACCRRRYFFRIHTFVGVNLDVIPGEEKLSKVVQPRVDVSAVVKEIHFETRPIASVFLNIKDGRTS